jgi:hypothetical protein
MNILIFLLLITFTTSSKNITIKHELDHGEDYIFITGLINGIRLFENLNRSEECSQVFSIFHDDIADIIIILKSITKDSDYIEVMRKILDRLDNLFKYMNNYEVPCKEMGRDLYIRINKLSQYINKEWIRKTFTHILSYIGDIRDGYDYFRKRLEEREFYIAGYTMGNLIRFMFFWDFPPI